MKSLFSVAALMATSALGGCGSSNQAPVVYGTLPTPTARIYNSPGEIAAERQAAAYSTSTRAWAYGPPPASTVGAAQAYAAQAPYTSPQPYVAAAASAPSAPSRLVPIAETYREERADRPLLLAQTSPGALTSEPRYEIAPAYQARFGAASSTYAPVATPISENSASAETLPGWVIVRPGDTVYGIARRNGTTPQTIIALNRLVAPFDLQVGEKIRVPSNNALAGGSAFAPSPVSSTPDAAPADRFHVVGYGDTLYSISRSTGVAVASIASANDLYPPYTLRAGDRLRIPGRAAPTGGGQIAARPAIPADAIARDISYGAPPAAARSSVFEWPVRGAIISSYGAGGRGKRNEGVNIAAPVGTPVRAAADGEVVYRGSELDGYGNLILIKHADGFVTAYAHNDAMLVKKGDMVRQGEVIAKVGQTGDANEPQLHFEVRQNLKAVDPVALLGSI